jgi:sRNA-binding regulator protein Hfq
MTTSQNLQELVSKEFKPLYPLEEKLLEAAPLGHEVSDFEPYEPIDLAQIGEAQTVRSELLIWLLTNSEVRESIHYKGINLRGARVHGILDLQDSTVEHPLRLHNCLVEEKLILDRGQYILLDFSSSHTSSISAKSIKVQHDFLMNDGFKAKGEVNLLGANIGSNLDCIDGEFDNPDGYALFGDHLTTKGYVFLRYVKAKGEVNFLSANIGSNLECDNAEFENPDGYALNGNRLTTKGSVFLRNGFKAKGEVNFVAANIGSNLECLGGEFENIDDIALNGNSLTTKGSVFLSDGFKAKGQVNFVTANIGSVLDCTDGVFDNPNKFALVGQGITTKGDVLLQEGFKAKGEVDLLGANIGGDLDCNKGVFEKPTEKPDSYALFGQGLTTKGSVFLGNGFKAKGEVNLVSANIGRVLICSGGEFDNPDGYAFNGRGLTTKGSVFLRKEFKAVGIVRFYGADIGGDLNCRKAKFDNNSKECFVGNNITVEGSFIWRKLMAKPNGIVSLENAKISYLMDDKESWPESENGKLYIDGLTYGPFSSNVPADSESRLEWLNLRPPDDTSVQPYEQLISVFRQMGLEDNARDIAIAKQRFIRKKLRGISRLWSWILDTTISYGYRPEKVIAWFIIPIIILGYFVFNWAN